MDTEWTGNSQDSNALKQQNKNKQKNPCISCLLPHNKLSQNLAA